MRSISDLLLLSTTPFYTTWLCQKTILCRAAHICLGISTIEALLSRKRVIHDRRVGCHSKQQNSTTGQNSADTINNYGWCLVNSIPFLFYWIHLTVKKNRKQAHAFLSLWGRHNSFGPFGSFIHTYVHTYAHTSFLPVLPALLAQAQAQVKLTAPHHTTHHSSSLPTASGPPPLRIV